METWVLRIDALNTIEYQFNVDNVVKLKNMSTLEGRLYNWMHYKTNEISIVRAKTTETNEDVVAIYIYYSRKNFYGKPGSHVTSKAYHLYNGNIYGKQGLIKSIPKEVKMSLKEVGIL